MRVRLDALQHGQLLRLSELRSEQIEPTPWDHRRRTEEPMSAAPSSLKTGPDGSRLAAGGMQPGARGSGATAPAGDARGRETGGGGCVLEGWKGWRGANVCSWMKKKKLLGLSCYLSPRSPVRPFFDRLKVKEIPNFGSPFVGPFFLWSLMSLTPRLSTATIQKALQSALIQKNSQTLHGTAIYAHIDPSGTTQTDRQSSGSPISRVWVMGCGGLLLEPQTTRKKWMFSQTTISYVKDFNCHIGTTICF